MKRMISVVFLAAAVPLGSAAADASFDPTEKISLELDDAKIADLVTTLGALANMPVYVDPDVSGSISIRMVDTPFQDVLKAISERTGVWVRIEGGNKLVASRSKDSFFAAVTVPERLRNAPRIPMAEVRRATSDLPPLFMRTRWNGAESCARLEFPEGERPTIAVPLSEDVAASTLYVTQFEVDPVTRTRYIALDGVVLGTLEAGRSEAALQRTGESGSLAILIGEKPVEPCRDQSVREEPPKRDVTVSFVAREANADTPGEIVMAPRVSLSAGTTAKMRSGGKDSVAGQQRELVLSAYVSRDGSWLAVVMMATAIWIDPADGGEYFYTQPSGVAESSLRRAPRVRPLAMIAPGAATPRAIELTVEGGGEGKPDTPRKR